MKLLSLRLSMQNGKQAKMKYVAVLGVEYTADLLYICAASTCLLPTIHNISLLQLHAQYAALKAERTALDTEQAALAEQTDAFEAEVQQAWGETLPGDTRMLLNVGGQRFETTVDVLTRDRFSLLAALCRPTPPRMTGCVVRADGAGRREVFVDRDWWLFRQVLAFLRHGALPEDDSTLRELAEEARFLHLHSMQDAVQAKLAGETQRDASSPPSTALPASSATMAHSGETAHAMVAAAAREALSWAATGHGADAQADNWYASSLAPAATGPSTARTAAALAELDAAAAARSTRGSAASTAHGVQDSSVLHSARAQLAQAASRALAASGVHNDTVALAARLAQSDKEPNCLGSMGSWADLPSRPPTMPNTARGAASVRTHDDESVPASLHRWSSLAAATGLNREAAAASTLEQRARATALPDPFGFTR